MDVDDSGLNQLVVDLGRAGDEARKKVSKAVRASAARIERDAKAFAPVDTGFLRNSIGRDIDDDGLGAEIGPTAEYGPYVELGTSRMAPRAYLGPAFDRAQPDFLDALAEAVAESLDES